MTVDSIVFMAIGLLIAGLIATAVMPLIHNRAVRLTTRRLEGTLPQSTAEIQADKDLLRAEFAMSTRRLETTVEQLRNKSTGQLVELGKKADAINRLKMERDALTIEVVALKTHVVVLKSQIEAAACSTGTAKQAELLPVAPAISQSPDQNTWTRDERLSEDTWIHDEHISDERKDTWADVERTNDVSIVPTIRQVLQMRLTRSREADTWEREESENDPSDSRS
jgi:hypothetical protein